MAGTQNPSPEPSSSQSQDAGRSPGPAQKASQIVVANDYQWIGNPQAAGFAVYVDGKHAGVAPLGGTFSQQVDPGRHVVRVRLWYFLSPRVELDVKPGETRRFSADRPRRVPWRRTMRGLVDPFHWLSLQEVSGLTRRLRKRISRDFPPGTAEEVTGCLTGLDTKTFDGQDPERVKAAVVLASNGEWQRFSALCHLAEVDWRDALVAGGLADDDWPDRLDAELPDS